MIGWAEIEPIIKYCAYTHLWLHYISMNEQIVAKCRILFLCNGEKFATLSKKKMPAKETKRARNTRTKSPSHIWSRRLERMCIPVVSVQSHHLIISTSYPLVFLTLPPLLYWRCWLTVTLCLSTSNTKNSLLVVGMRLWNLTPQVRGKDGEGAREMAK